MFYIAVAKLKYDYNYQLLTKKQSFYKISPTLGGITVNSIVS